jgi:NDP-sugar pyrophosphorylase family protein
MKAVILAAGEGTRLRPLTFVRPKPLIPLGAKPSIHYLLSHLSEEGFDDIVVVVGGPLKGQLMDYLGDGSKLGLRITYAVEPDGLRIGTAGSLKLIEHLLDKTFLVAQADTLTEIPLREAVDFHRASGAHATIVLTRVDDPSSFGVAVLDKEGTITEFQEKPSKGEAKGDLVSTGFYLMEPESIDYITDDRWDFAKDLFPSLLRLRKKLSGFASDAFWADIGNLEGYLRGVRWVLENTTEPRTTAAAEPPGLMSLDGDARKGLHVQVTSPVLIESGVTIEDEARISQYCVLMRSAHISSGTVLDRSVVMERASIGRGCTITDSVIGQSAILQGNVTVTASIIGPGCVVEEGAKVLNGSRLWPNVRIRADQIVNGVVIAAIEKAFYFCTGPGQYTGLLATTIEGFIEGLEKAPVESIDYHAGHRDFERWTRDVLRSNQLADSVEDVRRTAVGGEALRGALVGVAKEWAEYVEA